MVAPTAVGCTRWLGRPYRPSVDGLDDATRGRTSNINSHRLRGFGEHHQFIDLNEVHLRRRPAASNGTRGTRTAHAGIRRDDINGRIVPQSQLPQFMDESLRYTRRNDLLFAKCALGEKNDKVTARHLQIATRLGCRAIARRLLDRRFYAVGEPECWIRQSTASQLQYQATGDYRRPGHGLSRTRSSPKPGRTVPRGPLGNRHRDCCPLNGVPISCGRRLTIHRAQGNGRAGPRRHVRNAW